MNRNEGNQSCGCRVGEKETVEHLTVECNNYKSQRVSSIASDVTVIGKEQWSKRLVEQDGTI